MTDTNEMSAIELAAELTIAWLGNANTRATIDDVLAFLQKMHAALAALQVGTQGDTRPVAADDHVPAVTARKSLASRDHIVSMIDGKAYKTLRRHLSAQGITPAEYRERYKLPASYPMTAPAYSESRSALAKRIGLGRKPGTKVTPKDGSAKARAKRVPS